MDLRANHSLKVCGAFGKRCIDGWRLMKANLGLPISRQALHKRSGECRKIPSRDSGGTYMRLADYLVRGEMHKEELITVA